VVPALTSLEMCLPEALPDDLLEGKRAGGRNAFTAFHTRGVRVVVTFSPKLGTRELTCLGEPTWRCWPADSAHWYSIGLLRPWFSESLPPDECERRITAHFEAGAHREYREPNKTDPRRWQFDDGSAVPLGGKTRLPGSAWRIWGLRGYRLLPDGGAHGRDGSLVPEASLAQIAKEELLPWPGAALDWRPCGNEKSGLRLKALPTAGELAGPCAALPPLPKAEQLTADVLAPVSHVLAFNALLDVAWCKPSGLAAGAETVASSSAGGNDQGLGALGKRTAVPCDLGAGAKRQRPGAGESARSLPPSEVPGRRAEVLEATTPRASLYGSEPGAVLAQARASRTVPLP